MAPGFEFRIEQRVIDTNVEHPATSLFEIDGDVVKCVFEFGRETRGLGAIVSNNAEMNLDSHEIS